MNNRKFAGRVLLGIYMILAAGALLWIIYGVYLGNYDIAKTIAYATGIALAFIILLLKIKKRQSGEMGNAGRRIPKSAIYIPQ